MATDNNTPICGIYVIICMANKRFYVGSSVDIKRRWSQHRLDLRNNHHDNRHLQNAWNKYGQDAFKFHVLQLSKRQTLEDAEQRYLEMLQPFAPKGFNIAKVIRAPLKGVVFTAEHRANMSASFKKRPPRSLEYCQRISEGRKGIKPPPFTKEHCERISKSSTGLPKSPEHIEKMAETKRKTYIVTSPDGVEMTIKGMRRFCAIYGLHNAAMIKVAQGKQKAHKDWMCRYV